MAKLKWHDAMVAVNEAHIDSHEAMMAAEAAELEKKLSDAASQGTPCRTSIPTLNIIFLQASRK